jgi:hypothetical protein
LNRLVPKLPSIDYSGLRRRILGVDLSRYESLEGSNDLIIAVDLTGVSVHKAGGWIERKYGKKKRYVKIFFAVDVETQEALALMVTTDGKHDSIVFPHLLMKAESHGKVSKVIADRAFDSPRVYELLETKGIEAVIKPCRNSGFTVEKVEITGELQKKVEKGFIDWCVEVGVPLEKLEDRRRFWTFLKWVTEKPDVREKLVKTGWKSWNTKWRDKVFKNEDEEEILGSLQV